MHSWEYIEENRCFSNGGTNLHIHAIAQGRPEDNQVKILQGPHGIVNPPKNLVLNNIRRFTQMANGLLVDAVLVDECVNQPRDAPTLVKSSCRELQGTPGDVYERHASA